MLAINWPFFGYLLMVQLVHASFQTGAQILLNHIQGANDMDATTRNLKTSLVRTAYSSC